MEQIIKLMALMDRPAFCAENGLVAAANDAARSLQIVPGRPVEGLLATGREEYREFQSGCLGLELDLDGQLLPAAVTMVGAHPLFTLEPRQAEEELRILALASQALREPLADVMALAEALPPDSEQAAGISRGLHRILRLVGNMTAHPLPRMELVDINEIMRELWDRVQPACDRLGIPFRFTPDPMPVYTCADGSMLTRAVHNLLSNAMKSRTDGELHLQVSCSRSTGRYRISLTSPGTLPDGSADPFSRCLREPGTGSPEDGLGLGMRLVRSTATAHGGAALLHAPAPGTVCATLSMPLRQKTAGLRSPRLHISYTGEHDPMLVELSDVLPPEFYRE